MPYLLNDRLAPITSTIIFFEAEVTQVVSTFVQWQTPIQKKREVSLKRKPVRGSLEQALKSLLPLTSVEARRFLFIPTQSKWTAMFDNGWRGTDPSTYISKVIKCRALRVTAEPYTLTRDEPKARGRWGALIFSLYGPNSESIVDLNRSVYIANDGGKWEFKAIGTKQSFEEEQNYSLPRLHERFTLEMLERYLKSLGVNAFEESFYLPDGGAELVEKQGPTAKNLNEFSLEEARAHF